MSNLALHQLISQAEECRQRHQYEEAIASYTAVLEQTQPDSSDTELCALRLVALKEMGLLHRRSGQQEMALANYEQYRQEAKDSRQHIIALTQLGQQFTHMGQHDQALALHKNALQTAETLNYANGRAQAFLGIGATQYYLGHYDESIAQLKKALSLFMQLNDSENISRTWNWLGNVHMQLGEIDKSINALDEALKLVRVIGELETAVVLNNLGEAHQLLFDMDQALTYHREGLELAIKTTLPAQSIDVRRNLGVDLCYLGKVQEGIQYLEEALRMSQQYEDKDIAMQSLYSLALAEVENGNLTEAKSHAEQLEAIAKANNLRGVDAMAMHALGLYYVAIGDYGKATQLWQQVLFLAHETSQQNLLWRVHSALAKISDTPGLTETHNRIAAEVIDQIVYPIEDKALRQIFLNAPPIKSILDQVN